MTQKPRTHTTSSPRLRQSLRAVSRSYRGARPGMTIVHRCAKVYHGSPVCIPLQRAHMQLKCNTTAMNGNLSEKTLGYFCHIL